ncbi:MAG: hypothetical protein ACP5EK_05205 [Thermoplasmatota archaeon]
MEKYTTVSLPYTFHRELTSFIKDHPEMGYGSVAEFVKESVRIRMAEVRNEVRLIALQRLRNLPYRHWDERWDDFRNICKR